MFQTSVWNGGLCVMPGTHKNGDPKAAAVDSVVTDYAFLRLAIPINPRRPEPNSHTAAGTGTAAAGVKVA